MDIKDFLGGSSGGGLPVGAIIETLDRGASFAEGEKTWVKVNSRIAVSRSDYPDIASARGLDGYTLDTAANIHETAVNILAIATDGAGTVGFIDSSTGDITYSSDGFATSSTVSHGLGNGNAKDLRYMNGNWVATGWDGTNEAFSYSSDIAGPFTVNNANASSYIPEWLCSGYFGGAYFFSGAYQRVYKFASLSDTSPTVVYSLGSGVAMEDCAVGSGGIVFQPASGSLALLYSTDGSTFSDSDLTAITYCLFWTGSSFLAGGASGTIYRSTDDGATWTEVRGSGGALVSHVYSFSADITGGHIVAFDAGGRAILSDDDGATWNDETVGPFGSLSTNYDRNIALASNSKIMYGDSAGDVKGVTRSYDPATHALVDSVTKLHSGSSASYMRMK